jgi:hypothetical protein
MGLQDSTLCELRAELDVKFGLPSLHITIPPLPSLVQLCIATITLACCFDGSQSSAVALFLLSASFDGVSQDDIEEIVSITSGLPITTPPG